MDFIQYYLGYLGVRRILSGSSGCMVSHICEDTGIRLSQGSISSIHGLQYRGYKILCYHGIRILRSNLIGYLLLCLILCPDWDTEIFSNPMNGIEHPVLEQKKGKRGFWPLVLIYKNRGNMEDAWSGVVSIYVNEL